MITKERLDVLDREAVAADLAYQTAVTVERGARPASFRNQSGSQSSRLGALKQAWDLASRRRYDAHTDFYRQQP
jgi:hypothetical protein